VCKSWQKIREICRQILPQSLTGRGGLKACIKGTVA
jgi:hypothetical protein